MRGLPPTQHPPPMSRRCPTRPARPHLPTMVRKTWTGSTWRTCRTQRRLSKCSGSIAALSAGGDA
eukprot:1100243-Alexandrium_andersonii.AAC.1